MDRKEIVLAGLSTGDCDLFTPVQVQKLFFLIDKNISGEINGKQFFNFEPYNYGPFDKEVYFTLNDLAKDGYIEMISQGSWTSYKLSSEGLTEGIRIFKTLPLKAQEYMKSVSQIIKTLSFSQLVSAIYKTYPEMKANSVFQT